MLQRISKPAMSASLLMLVFSALLFSFTGKMGGDSFQVFVNKKLAIQQYVTMKEPVKSLQLDQSNMNDEVGVYYSHCGQTGTARVITIRDDHNKILKEWHYQDTPGSKATLNCHVKDIVPLQKLNSGSTLHLYYASHELPGGRLLAIITTSGNSVSTAP